MTGRAWRPFRPISRRRSRATAKALAFFEKLDGANRYAILYRLQTAKRPETRARRLQTFVEMCARHETLHPPRKTRP